uniref:Fibrinogen C-terminal domain-containing protein n=1 Tax=Macrostomum lignano TaxID=282301 RepID=A0A1I8IGN5_9PLAT
SSRHENSAGAIERPSCWQTFLHRVDASVDFYQNWVTYKSEFGQGPRLRWELSLWNDTWYWVENTWFLVLNETYKYQLFLGDQDDSVSNVIQCGANSSWYLNGSQFSTYDVDNDAHAMSCSVMFQGAWWYNKCHCFNPTGLYTLPPLALNMSTTGLWATGITYFTDSYTAYPFNHAYSMKKFEALISSTLG